jgi:ribose transport system permease protein
MSKSGLEASVKERPVSGARFRLRLSQEGIVAAATVVLFIYFSLTLPNFLSSENIITLIRNVAVLGTLSLGMAIVVIGRGVDLSLIATMAVSLTVSIVLANKGMPFGLALVCGAPLSSSSPSSWGF